MNGEEARSRAEAVFTEERLRARIWANAPGVWYARHRHETEKVLVCVRGSITFHTDSGDLVLGPGDRLDLPAGTWHAATVGPDGVECWEGHR